MNKEMKERVLAQQKMIEERWEEATYKKILAFDNDLAKEPIWEQRAYLIRERDYCWNHDPEEYPEMDEYGDKCMVALRYIDRVMTPLDWLRGGWYPNVKKLYDYAKKQGFEVLAKQLFDATHIRNKNNPAFDDTSQCSGEVEYIDGKPVLLYIALYGSPEVYDSIQFDGEKIVKATFVHNDRIRPELSYKEPITPIQ